MKFYFRSESFERKSTSIIFVNKLIIGCSKKKEENNYCPKKAFEQRKKETWIKV